MAVFAHLGEISRSRRYLLGRAQSLAIAIDRIDRCSCSQNRGVASVACSPQGDGGRVTAWRLAIRGAELDSNPPPTHPPPLAPPLPPFLQPIWPHSKPSRAAWSLMLKLLLPPPLLLL